MKNRSVFPWRALVASAALAAVAGLRAQNDQSSPTATAAATSTRPAETTWDDFQAVHTPPPMPDDLQSKPPHEFMAWQDANLRRAREVSLGFYREHPADPRRWEAATFYVSLPRVFAKGYEPDFDQTPGPNKVIVDHEAAAANAQAIREMLAAANAAPDAPADVRENLGWMAFATDFRAAADRHDQGGTVDWNEFMQRFENHIGAHPEQAPERAGDFLGALEQLVAGATVAEWRKLLDSPVPGMREKARATLQLIDPQSAFELRFTAVDGREVDVAGLRGKVVLVDFWATWCGPCKEEIPNVVANFGKYHAAGFEVIGISLDQAKDRQALVDFTREKGMTWPQYFDGKGWKNDIAAKYGVQAVPAMFLLDQDGRIVSTNARGPKLEQEIKRLLKL